MHDDSTGRAAPLTGELGLPIGGGWESPHAGAALRFKVNCDILSGLPDGADFPQSGEVRWRPAMAGRAAPRDTYVSLIKLKDATGRDYGDGMAYIGRQAGGRILYVSQRLPGVFGCMPVGGVSIRGHEGARVGGDAALSPAHPWGDSMARASP